MTLYCRVPAAVVSATPTPDTTFVGSARAAPRAGAEGRSTASSTTPSLTDDPQYSTIDAMTEPNEELTDEQADALLQGIIEHEPWLREGGDSPEVDPETGIVIPKRATRAELHAGFRGAIADQLAEVTASFAMAVGFSTVLREMLPSIDVDGRDAKIAALVEAERLAAEQMDDINDLYARTLGFIDGIAEDFADGE